ncbi:OmpA family protein [Anaplasma capra]|uniref:OmpA family protein n=1 Tax=Anaplasma capra TaxID=1562740 RepID=UPI0021D5E995|nr:OmpA family protein [Anaplasma capra]
MTGCHLFSKEKVGIDVGGVSFSAGGVEKVYFDFNKYEIRGSGKKVLLSLVERMKADKGSTLLIVGHTDSRGTEEYNLALGERRANAVKEFLVGCDRSLSPRIFTQSRGKAEPEILVYSSDFKEAEKAHAQNRRVVLVMEHQEAPLRKTTRWPFSFGSGKSSPGEESTADNSSSEGAQAPADEQVEESPGEEQDDNTVL